LRKLDEIEDGLNTFTPTKATNRVALKKEISVPIRFLQKNEEEIFSSPEEDRGCSQDLRLPKMEQVRSVDCQINKEIKGHYFN
jgi:hypothetical protein